MSPEEVEAQIEAGLDLGLEDAVRRFAAIAESETSADSLNALGGKLSRVLSRVSEAEGDRRLRLLDGIIASALRLYERSEGAREQVVDATSTFAIRLLQARQYVAAATAAPLMKVDSTLELAVVDAVTEWAEGITTQDEVSAEASADMPRMRLILQRVVDLVEGGDPDDPEMQQYFVVPHQYAQLMRTLGDEAEAERADAARLRMRWLTDDELGAVDLSVIPDDFYEIDDATEGLIRRMHAIGLMTSLDEFDAALNEIHESLENGDLEPDEIVGLMASRWFRGPLFDVEHEAIERRDPGVGFSVDVKHSPATIAALRLSGHAARLKGISVDELMSGVLEQERRESDGSLNQRARRALEIIEQGTEGMARPEWHADAAELLLEADAPDVAALFYWSEARPAHFDEAYLNARLAERSGRLVRAAEIADDRCTLDAAPGHVEYAIERWLAIQAPKQAQVRLDQLRSMVGATDAVERLQDGVWAVQLNGPRARRISLLHERFDKTASNPVHLLSLEPEFMALSSDEHLSFINKLEARAQGLNEPLKTNLLEIAEARRQNAWELRREAMEFVEEEGDMLTMDVRPDDHVHNEQLLELARAFRYLQDHESAMKALELVRGPQQDAARKEMVEGLRAAGSGYEAALLADMIAATAGPLEKGDALRVAGDAYIRIRAYRDAEARFYESRAAHEADANEYGIANLSSITGTLCSIHGYFGERQKVKALITEDLDNGVIASFAFVHYLGPDTREFVADFVASEPAKAADAMEVAQGYALRLGNTKHMREMAALIRGGRRSHPYGPADRWALAMCEVELLLTAGENDRVVRVVEAIRDPHAPLGKADIPAALQTRLTALVEAVGEHPDQRLRMAVTRIAESVGLDFGDPTWLRTAAARYQRAEGEAATPGHERARQLREMATAAERRAARERQGTRERPSAQLKRPDGRNRRGGPTDGRGFPGPSIGY